MNQDLCQPTGDLAIMGAGLLLAGFLIGGLAMHWRGRHDRARLEHAESMTSIYLKSLDVDTHPTPDASQDRCPWPPPDPR